MSTALDIIKESLELLNYIAAGEAPNAIDANKAFKWLNYLLDSWNNQSLALYNTSNVTVTLQAHKNPHTLGVGGDFNIARPLKITRAFVRKADLTTPVDFLLEQVDNDRYQEFIVKNIQTTYPTHFYYDSSYPLASFYTYPVQTVDLELHLSVWSKLTRFAALTTEATFPEGYELAMIHKLAVLIAPSFGITDIVKGHPIYENAAVLMRDIKAVNQNDNHMNLDFALLNGPSHGFNIMRGF